MATINITWDTGTNKPSADDITVNGKNSTVITWVPDNTVDVSAISTPSDGSNDDFTAPAKVGQSDNWQCTDSCANDGTYSYNITATAATGGPEAMHDPKITNDRED